MIVYIHDLVGLVFLAGSSEDGDEDFKIWEEILENAV